MTKQASERMQILFLQLVAGIVGCAAITLNIFMLVVTYNGWEGEYPAMVALRFPVIAIVGASLVPFLIALYQIVRLLGFVSGEKVFSERSIAALEVIKKCALVFSALYILFLPIAYQIAQAEDAPGIMIIGLILAGAPMVFATFASVLQRVIRSGAVA